MCIISHLYMLTVPSIMKTLVQKSHVQDIMKDMPTTIILIHNPIFKLIIVS